MPNNPELQEVLGLRKDYPHNRGDDDKLWTDKLIIRMLKGWLKEPT